MRGAAALHQLIIPTRTYTPCSVSGTVPTACFFPHQCWEWDHFVSIGTNLSGPTFQVVLIRIQPYINIIMYRYRYKLLTPRSFGKKMAFIVIFFR
jgi:hypothetical protein